MPHIKVTKKDESQVKTSAKFLNSDAMQIVKDACSVQIEPGVVQALLYKRNDVLISTRSISYMKHIENDIANREPIDGIIPQFQSDCND
jgi:hypothetical protein